MGNLQSLEEAYRTFLNQIAKPYGSSLSSFSDEINTAYQKFLDANGPKEFGHFKEALIAYGQVREVVIPDSAESSVWKSIQSALKPFEEAVSVSLPSTDYAYSRWRYLSRNRWHLAFGHRCHVDCYRAWCFLCNLSR